MILNKSEIKALRFISFGAKDRTDLAQALNVTENRVTPIIKSLRKKSFIKIKLDNRRKIITLSNNRPINSFKQMIIINPGINISEFLYGFNLRLLSYCLLSWKSIEDIANKFGISEKTVLNRTLKLRERQLLIRRTKLLKFNRNTWKDLYEFLRAYRHFTTKQVNVLWKFEEEMVFEVNKNQVEGSLTGFSAYNKYGVNLNTIRHCCYLPEKKLSKEHVFIHSLMQIRKDVRLLELAIVFFYMNRLSQKKIVKLASKYDRQTTIREFFMIIENNDTKNLERLPSTSKEGVNEMLTKYKVKKQK